MPLLLRGGEGSAVFGMGSHEDAAGVGTLDEWGAAFLASVIATLSAFAASLFAQRFLFFFLDHGLFILLNENEQLSGKPHRSFLLLLTWSQ